ncbi:MAG: PAS domain S-box protein [Planctomycetota bacterium]|nr:PAS domain S-box protein [Planctomycetota bacterium]
MPEADNAFLAALVETSRDAMFRVGMDGAIRSWNPAAKLLFGYDADEVLGKSVAIFAPPDRSAEPLEFFARVCAGETVHAETQRMRKDGTRFDAAVSISPILDSAGRVRGAAGTVRDVTRRKIAEARLLTEHAIARVLAEASSITEAMPQILEAVCRITGWEWGALWRPTGERTDVLRCELTWSQALDPRDEQSFNDASRGMILPAGVGLPGRVFANGQPEWIADVSGDGNFPRHDAAAAAGLHGALCFPISWRGLPLGVMEFLSKDVKPPDEPLLGMMSVVGGQIGQFIDRRQSVRALQASEARNTAVLEAALDCIVAMDHTGRVIEWNPAAARTFGYTRGEAVGREMAMLIIPPQLRDRHRAGLARYLNTGEGPLLDQRLEIDGVHKDGSTFPVELTITRLPSDKTAPTFVGFLRDISVRKRVEQQLRESEEHLRLAIAIAQMGTFQIDLLTDGVTVNEPGRAIYGWSLDEPLTFAKVQTHFHPADRKRVIESVADSFRPDGPGGFEVEQRIIRTDGETRWIRVRGRTLFEGAAGAERRPVRCVGTYIDVTVQKQAEHEREQLLAAERTSRAEAERASRMKDEFLATLSHELRTPLNAILGWATILKDGANDAGDLQRGLETIERNARAQTQIIEDLLDMSRIISGKVRLDVQRVGLAEAARSAIETVRPGAEAKGVRLNAVLDPHAGAVSGDPNRLQQVLWNLLSNAIKFTPRGGRVQVELARVNSHVELSISDTGEGIEPAFLPHVFDRFRQADSSTTRKYGGLGLGLAIVKQLIELHGGSVRAHSAGPGAGATFTVSLPLTALRVEPDGDDHERRHPQGGSTGAPVALPDQCVRIAGVRVLVVDDEPDARMLVRRLLEDCDAIVSTAESAGEALRRLEQERPDVLVSDIGMPGEDGYSLIRRVRALGADRGGNTPAVALTAYARAEDRVRSVLAGFQMHVAKPVEPTELITMVASLAGRTGVTNAG